MGAALAVREYRKPSRSSRWILDRDVDTGRRILVPEPIGNTLVLSDLAQAVSLAASCRRTRDCCSQQCRAEAPELDASASQRYPTGHTLSFELEIRGNSN